LRKGGVVSGFKEREKKRETRKKLCSPHKKETALNSRGKGGTVAKKGKGEKNHNKQNV